MLKREEVEAAQRRAAAMIRQAGIVITEAEQDRIAVADFGLSRLAAEGAQILTLLETARVALKIIALFPQQTLPEHWHPPVGNDPGKEETIRVVSGALWFYLPGAENMRHGFIPEGKEACYSVRNEIRMGPGDQITLAPGTKHWFQAGPAGAVLYSISSCARDILDRFSDPDVVR
ncbi:MAG: hypothetical protein JSW39_05495, partial [Desulfobacterales bacterium]